MKTGIQRIVIERDEQIRIHNYTPDWDLQNNQNNQIVLAIRALLNVDLEDREHGKPPYWDEKAWAKMCRKSHEQRLVMVGAFAAAEIDRLQNS